MFERVRNHIYTWCATMQGHKFSQTIPHLVGRQFSPLRTRRHKVVHWELPSTGKLKLNVDAAVGCTTAATSAVLRNHQGEFVSAICFSLPASSSLRDELMVFSML